MEYNHDDYTIRFARPEDLEALIQVEAECFPAAEAAGRESFQARLEVFPDSSTESSISPSIARAIT